MLEQVHDEGDVGGHAPDPELPQGPVHPPDRRLGRARPGRHLGQQRIVVAGDDRARIGRAAVEPDAEARGRTVGGDAPVIGDEGVLRVLGRDPALHRVAVQRDVVLRCDAGCLHQRLALGDQDLRPDDVDAGDFLGHGMLDLNAGVHLDEEELARVHVHQELDRPRAFVGDVLADLLAKVADVLALHLRQVRGRGPLHDLLVAPLDRAVALVEVVDVAVAVAQDLHLDMARAGDELLEIAFAVAERGLRLAPSFQHLLLELVLGRDRAHAPPAAAPGRLEHQRIANLGGLLADRVHIVAQNVRRRHDRNARRDGHLPRAGLVAELPHRLGLGADEGDAGGGAGIHEVGVLRQEAVARMDRVRAGQLRHPDDLGDRQVRRDRPQPLADPVGLVRLEAVQAQLVLLGIDRDGALAHLVGRAHHPDGDLAPVCDKDLLELGHGTLGNRSPDASEDAAARQLTA